MEERARRFALLFRGSPRGHGDFNAQPDGVTAGAKVEGPRRTVHSPASDSHFERHLAGEYGLGAVPLLLDPPGTTTWAAVDIDVYGIMDIAAWARMVAARGLPFVVCRSKSGGAHNHVFLTEPAEAAMVRRKLKEMAAALGFPDAEVFPKQDALGDDPEGGQSYWGNWINLPYYGGDRSTRYALDKAGVALTVEEFLNAAEAARMTPAELRDFELPPDELSVAATEELPEAPPCLVRMAAGGVVSGNRNQALFAAATYFRRADPTNILTKTEGYNQAHLVPPLSSDDVRVIVRSAQKKDYNYRCKESPMCGLCDRETCEERKFGVLFGRDQANGDLALELGPLLKIMTQPPLWRWRINGEWVEFSTEELTTQRLFLRRVLDVTNARPRPVKPRAWEKLLDDAIATARIELAPSEATLEGQLLHHLTQFCTGRAQAKELDEILLHKPFTDPDGWACFVVADLLAYLNGNRVTGITERWVYLRLMDRGLQTTGAVLKGKPTQYWRIPPLDRQTEEFAVPKADDDVPF